MIHRYQSAIDNFYEELAVYLRKIYRSEEPFEKKKSRAIFYRGLNNSVIRFNFLIKALAGLGLIACCLFMICTLFFSSVCLSYFDIFLVIFIVSILAKIFSPLVDLETRYIQYALLAVITMFFMISDPGSVFLHSAVALFFSFFISFSRYAKYRMKIAVLDMMFSAPNTFAEILTDNKVELNAALDKLNIQPFDKPDYHRHFSVSSSRKKRSISVLPAPEKECSLPEKKTFCVQVWSRDPQWDLSSIREFSVCCFLGGSQDASAFDFLMSKTLTMLDMVSPRGRVIRVLLMACISKVSGRKTPILVVNAVFGREGGLAGSVNDDNTFIKEQIEAYGRYCGFTKIVYSTSSTNKRPRLFIESLKKAMRKATVSLKCQLVDCSDSLKLEIFNRREPGGNLYLMLLLEIMNFTDNYAVKGSVCGYSCELENHFLECSPDTVKITEGELININCGVHTLTIDKRLFGKTAECLLSGFMKSLPELDTTGVPDVIIIVFKEDTRQFVEGTPLNGHLAVHPGLLNIEDGFFRESIFSIAVIQSFLWTLHPKYNEDLLFQVLDTLLPEFNTRAVNILSQLEKIEEKQYFSAGSNFLHTIITRAIAAKYQAKKAFKIKSIYSWLQSESEQGTVQGQESFLLAEKFFNEKLAEMPHLGEKYFTGLNIKTRPLVYRQMIKEIQQIMEHFRTPLSLAELTPENFHEVADKIYAYEKTIGKFRLEQSDKETSHLEDIKNHIKLMSQLEQIEHLLDKYNIAKARETLEQIEDSKKDLVKKYHLRPFLFSLKMRIMLAPINRLTDKLNMDQHF